VDDDDVVEDVDVGGDVGDDEHCHCLIDKSDPLLPPCDRGKSHSAAVVGREG